MHSRNCTGILRFGHLILKMILQIYKFNTYLLNALMLICSIWILQSSQHCLHIKYLEDIGKNMQSFREKWT